MSKTEINHTQTLDDFIRDFGLSTTLLYLTNVLARYREDYNGQTEVNFNNLFEAKAYVLYLLTGEQSNPIGKLQMHEILGRRELGLFYYLLANSDDEPLTMVNPALPLIKSAFFAVNHDNDLTWDDISHGSVDAPPFFRFSDILQSRALSGNEEIAGESTEETNKIEAILTKSNQLPEIKALALARAPEWRRPRIRKIFAEAYDQPRSFIDQGNQFWQLYKFLASFFIEEVFPSGSFGKLKPDTQITGLGYLRDPQKQESALFLSTSDASISHRIRSNRDIYLYYNERSKKAAQPYSLQVITDQTERRVKIRPEASAQFLTALSLLARLTILAAKLEEPVGSSHLIPRDTRYGH